MDKLIDGNLQYLAAGDIFAAARADTAANGQHPYAVVVTCSDSRVPPEHIFGAGLGELFVIRTAGNVIGDFERGTVEYAVGHLNVPLVIVMGHTHCGAVGAALDAHGHHAEGSLGKLVAEISNAIGQEKDEFAAVKLNIQNSITRLRESSELQAVEIIGAVYDIESGKIDWQVR